MTTKEKQTQIEPGTASKHGQKNRWTVEEKKILAAITFPIMEMQKKFGQKYDPKLTMQGWENKFAGRFTVEQIIYALDKYTDRNKDFPTPACLIEILEPETPKITQAEFIAAQKWQERNGFPIFSDAKILIEKYQEQEQEKRDDHVIECDKIKQIAENSVKSITQQKQIEGVK